MIGVRGDNVLCGAGLPGVQGTVCTTALPEILTRPVRDSFSKQSLSPACICADILSCVRREGPVYAPVLVSEVTMYCVEEGSGATAGSQVPGQKGLELSSVNYRVTTLHYTVHYTPTTQCAIFLFILSGSRGFMFI